jgi:lysozyme family protein
VEAEKIVTFNAACTTMPRRFLFCFEGSKTMAKFEPAFDKMIQNEGGYKLHDVTGDRGGQTYAGIARNFHPQWPGWHLIDNGQRDAVQLTELVMQFYREKFWNLIRGDDLTGQGVAETLFDFAVNAGTRTAIKLAQIVLNTTPDGAIGPETVSLLNSMGDEDFKMRYALAKIARYTEIVSRDRNQGKFLLGWINRTLKGVA